MTTEFIEREKSNLSFSIGRPRWESLLTVVSVVVFWGGVILKIFG